MARSGRMPYETSGIVVTSGLFLAVVLGLEVCPTVTRDDVGDPEHPIRQAV